MSQSDPSWVYILATEPRGPIYIGVTTNLVRRVAQHRDGRGSAHAQRYNIKKLVYFERHASVVEAIAREKRLKRWRRAWKTELIEGFNPTWKDLYYELVQDLSNDSLRFPLVVGGENIVIDPSRMRSI